MRQSIISALSLFALLSFGCSTALASEPLDQGKAYAQSQAQSEPADDDVLDLEPSTEAAQTRDYVGDWWVNLGLGGEFSKIYHNKDDQEFADVSLTLVNAELNYVPFKNRLLTLRAISNYPIILEDLYQEIGPMYGIMSKDDNGYVAASAGVSYLFMDNGLSVGLIESIFDNDDNKKPERKIETIGFPFEVQAYKTLSQHVGLGVSAFTTVSPKAVIGGLSLNMQFGRLN